jgi:hypothetical protein
MGIDVKENLVAKALDEFKAAFKDEAAYNKALEEMGFSEAMLKEQIKNGLTIKALIDQAVLKRFPCPTSRSAPITTKTPTCSASRSR